MSTAGQIREYRSGWIVYTALLFKRTAELLKMSIKGAVFAPIKTPTSKTVTSMPNGKQPMIGGY